MKDRTQAGGASSRRAEMRPGAVRAASSRGAHSRSGAARRVHRGAVEFSLVLLVLAFSFSLVAGNLADVVSASSGGYAAHASEAASFTGEVNSETVPMPASALAAALDSPDFYFTQSGPGRCTAAAAAMMLRRASYAAGGDWQAIDEAAVVEQAWTSGGLKNSFELQGMQVSWGALDFTADDLVAMLASHKEGIVVYDPSLPHAVVVTDYDEATGIFYAADPAGSYSGARIPLAETWNGRTRGGQEGAIAALKAYWAIDR